MDVQWYPGHMTKARRMMEENIRLVDLVIELVDARIPLSSRNPDIDALCRGKGRIVLLCKADLADPARTEAFEEYFRKKGILAAAVDAREKKAGDIVRRYVQEACREKLERDRARGIIGRPLRAMVAGIPNVGKSTFINSFAGRASAKTGNKPGVTRGKQWIRLSGNVELLDTPGILWPKFDNRRIGMHLALMGAIRDEILDKEELAVLLLEYLTREYPGVIEKKYLGDNYSENDHPENDHSPVPDSPDLQEAGGNVPRGLLLLEKIAAARHLLVKGGAPDTARAAALLLDDCKNGRIGRISLESPEDAPEFESKKPEDRKETGKRASDRKEPGKQPAEHRAACKKEPGRRPAEHRASGRKEPGRRPAEHRASDNKESGKRPAEHRASGRKEPGRRPAEQKRRKKP